MKALVDSKNPIVGIFNPSQPIFGERLNRLYRNIKLLSEWNIQIVLPDDSIIDEWSNFRSPKERYKEIKSLLNNENINILFAAWGGKNSNDLLSLLDFLEIKEKRKAWIGTSDIGVILNPISYFSETITFYGPNVLGKLDETQEKSLSILSKEKITLGYNLIKKSYDCMSFYDGECEGNLIGGDLSTFTIGLAGTSYFPFFEKSILFFESLSLDEYNIRQHLCALKNKGCLRNVVGLIIGNTASITSDLKLYNTIIDLFDVKIPILKSNFFGHGNLPNPIIPIGAKVYLSTKTFEIILLEDILELC